MRRAGLGFRVTAARHRVVQPRKPDREQPGQMVKRGLGLRLAVQRLALDRVDHPGQLALQMRFAYPQVNRLPRPKPGIVNWYAHHRAKYQRRRRKAVHRAGRQEYRAMCAIAAGSSGDCDPSLTAREPEQNRPVVASHRLRPPAPALGNPRDRGDLDRPA